MSPKLDKIQTRALELMLKYNLVQRGWTFGFINSLKKRRTLGDCSEKWKRIRVGLRHAIMDNDWEDTVLHEIAHAIVGCDHKHDEVWQAVAAHIGAIPSKNRPVAAKTEMRLHVEISPGTKIVWGNTTIAQAAPEAPGVPPAQGTDTRTPP